MTRPALGSISPFFIVSDMAAALSFYCDRLGFAVTFRQAPPDDFFAIVSRAGAMILLKDVGVAALPNCERMPDARWDACVFVPEA